MPTPTPNFGRRALGDFARGRYVWLTCALVATIVLAPLLKDFRLGVRMVDALLVLVLVASVRSIVQHTRWLIALGVLAAMAAFLMLTHYVRPSGAIGIAFHIPLLAFLAIVTVMILLDILATSKVSMDTIAGAVCAYMQIGFLFAVTYSLISAINDEAFRQGDGFAPPMDFLSDGFGLAVYFSFVTLTTVGFGDLTPIAPFARGLTVVEAMVGQLYLTILVARLVGMHISLRSEGERPPAPAQGSVHEHAGP